MIVEAWIVVAASLHISGNAKTGFWKDPPGETVWNVVRQSEDELQALLDALEAHTPGCVSACYAWIQGDGHGRPNPWPIDDDAVIALMADHVTYDEAGTETSRTPATRENPHWGHVWQGQRTRFWAGDFTDDFTEEFY